jgi:ATP-binding cassette subfamily B protein
VAATALSIAAYIYVTRKITEWRTHLREKMNRLDGQALARAVDLLLNYETVKYFAAEQREEPAMAPPPVPMPRPPRAVKNSLGMLNIAQGLVINLLMAGPSAYTVWGWTKGVSSGQLVFVQTYLTQLFRPLDMLGMVYRTIRQGLIDMADMFRLIDTQQEVQDKPGAPALVVRQPSVVFDNVVLAMTATARSCAACRLKCPPAIMSRWSARRARARARLAACFSAFTIPGRAAS